MKKHYYTKDILEVCDGSHLTVDEIFMQIQKKFPQVGRSSIYRNVENMSKSGDLNKVIGTGKKVLFEKSKKPHAHFICKNSGKILDIPLEHILEANSFSTDKISKDDLIKSIDSVDIKIYGTLSA